MLAEEDDRDYAAPPIWIGRLMAELDRQEKLGTAMDRDALIGLFTFCARLEVEDYPAPAVEVVNRGTIRLTWQRPLKVLQVEVVGERHVDIKTSNPRFKAGERWRTLIPAAREVFAWYANRPAPTPIKEDES